MHRAVFFCSVVLIGLATTTNLVGDEVRRVTIDGVDYVETVRVVQKPVSRVTWHSQQRQVLAPSVAPAREVYYRTRWLPVTNHQWETRVHNWWNPFQPNTVGYHFVPRTRWVPHTERVEVPVVSGGWVAETRRVEVPQRTLGFEEQRILVSRVPAGSRTASTSARQPVPEMLSPREAGRRAATANRRSTGSYAPATGAAGEPTIDHIRPQSLRLGGLGVLENDPPRRGDRTGVLR